MAERRAFGDGFRTLAAMRASTRWLLALVAVAAVVIMFLVLRPEPQQPVAVDASPTPESTGSTPSPAEPTATATLDPVEIEVEEGRVEGPRTISVALGERVAFEVEVDVADHVHVHTYDILQDVSPGRPWTITFEATIPGVHEIELENAGLLLTRLEVTP